MASRAWIPGILAVSVTAAAALPSATALLARTMPAAPAAAQPAAGPRMQAHAPPRRAVTHAQREEAADRVDRARRIIARMERDARANGLGPDWRRSLFEALLPLGTEALREMETRALTVGTMAAAIAEVTDDPGLIGDRDKDLMFTPIVPCRFIDTRSAAGKIAGVRAYDADANGATYGGSAACDPRTLLNVAAADQIGALAMNVTIVDTSAAGAPGFLAVKPTAQSPTTSLLNWYQAAGAVQIANQGVVTLEQASTHEFVIETSGAVHVVVDLFGAFVEPQATPIETMLIVSAIESTPENNTEITVAGPCPFTHALLGGGCETGQPNHVITGTFAQQNDWWCVSKNNSGMLSSQRAYAICGRVPGR